MGMQVTGSHLVGVSSVGGQKRASQAKVGDLAGVGTAVYQYILGFQVSVQNALAMHRLQPLQYLERVELQHINYCMEVLLHQAWHPG
jgi:hypothetical protein